jgi:ATP-dependent protease ClpP protease subunit
VWHTANTLLIKIIEGCVKIMMKLVTALILAVLLIVPTLAVAEEDCVCMEDTAKGMVVENPDMELSQLTGITQRGAYMKIFSGLSVADVISMWNDLIYLKDNTDIRDVNMFINSPGGDAFSGMALADQIVQAQKEWGFTFHAHASGVIASAAVPVFAVCKSRNARPGTIFMVHEAALWKWPGRESASDIESQNKLMKIIRDTYLAYLVHNSNLDYDEWRALEKKTTWFNVEQAREWGLIERGEE